MSKQLYKQYIEKVAPALKEELGFKNVMQVPKIKKVVINIGYGRNLKDKPYIENLERTIQVITGQKPVHNKAKKSISNFKIREGMPIGISVTLRGAKMYEFLYKLINIVLPRVRDFRGINPKSFDAQGNYTIGFKENIAFPEIASENQDKIHGLEVIINTSATNIEHGFALLSKLGFPFKNK